MDSSETIEGQSAAEALEEWLDWPGMPFDWQKCDSPIEDDVFHELYKFAGDQVALRRQHEVKTEAGNFRLDFLLTHRTTGRPIAIECDGKDFHDATKDRSRDRAILRTGKVAALYRVKGKDCYYCGLDVLQLLAQLEPWLVMPRFFEQATVYPHPTSYRDEHLGELEDGYSGSKRTYLEQVEGEYETTNCYCEGACECVPMPVMTESRVRTPTLIRFLSAPGFPSAYSKPSNLIPLPLPEWKVRLKEFFQKQVKKDHGEA
jgi:hypothetical protein